MSIQYRHIVADTKAQARQWAILNYNADKDAPIEVVSVGPSRDGRRTYKVSFTEKGEKS